MSKLMVVILIVGYFIVPQTAMISRRYIRNMDFDDKKSDGDLLGEDSLSFKDCAEKCRGDCGVFGYNDRLKKCRLHRKLHMSSASEEEGWRYFFRESIPADCTDLYTEVGSISGVYDIFPYRTITMPVTVYCDMTTMGGGVTAIQKRVDGSLSFNRTWTDYKNGFGAPEQDYWIGNDVIHLLTKGKNSSLYVSITLQNGTTLYEMYDQFSISNETGKYQLFLTGPATGTLGDGMINTGNSRYNLPGSFFSTLDRDNDRYSDRNCAAYWGGGWWFNECYRAFLNGPWTPAESFLLWWPTVYSGSSMRGTTMMIRHH